MTTFFLIRHAEAEGNVYRRSQGQYDALLTLNGKRQADFLAQRFADIHLDAIFSSDLTRTVQTAQPLAAQKGLQIQTDPALREYCMGEWEDLPWGELPVRYPEAYALWSDQPHLCQAPGGESMQALSDRVYDAIFRIAHACDGRTIAIFSHGAAIRTFLCRAHYQTLEQLNTVHWGDNTCVAQCTIDSGKIHILFENDTTHLPAEASTLGRQKWWRNGKDTNARFFDAAADNDYILSTLEAELEAAGGTPAERQTALREFCTLLEQPGQAYLVSLGKQIIGFVLLYPFEKGKAGRIAYLYLEPDYRQHNIGAQLLGQAVSVLRKRGCKTLSFLAPDPDVPVVRLAKNNGFVRQEGSLYTLEI